MTFIAPSLVLTPNRLSVLPISIHRLVYRFAPGTLRARLKNQIPLGVDRFPLRLPDGQILLLDHLEHSKILRRFAWKGIHGHEPQTIRLFQVLAKRALEVLDIGAYFGLYALIAAKSNPKANVHAFEPVPENRQLLRHFLELNQVTCVSVHPVAVARECGKGVLYIPARRHSALPPTGSLKNRFLPGEVFNGRTAHTLEVRTEPLDTLIEHIGVERIDLVKIDTEETEHDVIAGGVRMLERYRPDVVMEVIFGNPNVADALSVLHELGYRFFCIEPAGLYPFDDHDPRRGKQREECEIFCTCREDSEVSRLARYLNSP